MATSKKLTGETLFDLTSYVAATPASPFQQQANATAQTTHDTFGLGLEKPLANYDLNTQSWKMYEDTFLSDSTLYSGKWPASGMTLNGKLFPQPQLVRHIVEIVSLLWPTPTANDSKNVNPKANRRPGLVAAVNNAPTPSGNWPTPTTADVYTDNLTSSQQTDGSMHSVTLGQAVQMWPTMTANGMGSSGHRELLEKHVNSGDITQDEKKQMSAGNGGKLNPMWVEWLMGFPLEWTDLKDSETP